MPEAAGVAQILASCGIVSSYCWAKQLHPPENPETKKSTVPAQSSKPTGKSGYPKYITAGNKLKTNKIFD